METLNSIIKRAIEKYPDKVKEYRNGKTGLIGLFVGYVMLEAKGNADPKTVNSLVKIALDGEWQILTRSDVENGRSSAYKYVI